MFTILVTGLAIWICHRYILVLLNKTDLRDLICYECYSYAIIMHMNAIQNAARGTVLCL